MTGDVEDEARFPPTIVRAEVVRRAPEEPAAPTMPSVRDRQREVRRRLERDADRPRHLAQRWAGLLLFLSLFGIVYCTLFPFNFTVPAGMTLREAAHAFTWKLYDPSNIPDSWQNVLLFGPLGFALAALLYSRRHGRPLSALAPIAAGAILSTSVEILQLWLPTRVSALGDIVTNTVGTACGSVLFAICGASLLSAATICLDWLRRALNPVVSLVLILLVSLAALRSPLHMRHVGHDLMNWDSSYPLAVGNTPDDGRYWAGSIERIEIADQAITRTQAGKALASGDLREVLGDSVLASYVPQSEPLPTVDGTGHSPALHRVESRQPYGDAQPPVGAVEHWMISDGPLENANAAIGRSSHFTLHVICSGGGEWFEQLHRIVAIASDYLHSNLIVGQEGYDLVLRLRTILTGDNGTNPASIIQNVFRYPGRHDILVSYSDPTLDLYLDGRRMSIQMPADFSGVYHILARPMTLPFSGFGRQIYRAAFYFLYLCPIGLLLGFLAVDPRLPARWKRPALLTALLLPGVLLQVVIVGICGRQFRLDNVFYGVAAPAVVMLGWGWWLGRSPNATSSS